MSDKRYNYASNDEDQAAAYVLSEVKSHTDRALQPLQAEVRNLADQVLDVQQRLEGRNHSVGDSANDGESIGQMLIRSAEFENFRTKSNAKFGLSVKNTILGESGSPQNPDGVIVRPDRVQGIVPGAFRSLSLLDFLPRAATLSNLVEYTRENAWTNNAAERAEGAQKPQSDLTFSLVQEPVRTIPHFLKVSRQALDDSAALASYIDARMSHGVRARLQQQIITGNGTAPNLAGLNASGRHVAYNGGLGLALIDQIGHAADQVVSADHTPTVIFANPLDIGEIIRERDEDGRYVLGDGGAVQLVTGGLPSIWGLPVVRSNAVPRGTVFVLDHTVVLLFIRQDAVVQMFEQDDKNVQTNLVTIRAEMRAALAVLAPAAVVKIVAPIES